MKLISTLLIILVALLHIGFMVLEMAFWDHEIGRKVFSMTAEQSSSSVVLAMNQGLYNGFLAAGLLWGLLKDSFDFKAFFLVCVLVAGIFGAITAKPTILLIQGLPALMALIATWLSRTES